MAKMNPMFSFSGTFNEVTQVNSKRYGKHIRRKRGSIKPALLNAAFQKSVALNALANPVAKAIKRAFDPYREGFSDGSMWGRLLSVFKKHLREHPDLDLRILNDFELYDKIYLRTHYHHKSEVTILKGAHPYIHIELSSSASLYLERYEVNSYRQTLVVIFLNADLQATAVSDQVMFPLEKQMEYNNLIGEDSLVPVKNLHVAEWPIPSGTKWILMTVKCEPYRNNALIGRMKIKGMSAVKVLEV